MSNYGNGGWGSAVPSVHDAVVNNEITRNIPNKIIFVSNATELSSIADEPVGTFAATYGFKQMWQFNGANTWISMTDSNNISVSN